MRTKNVTLLFMLVFLLGCPSNQQIDPEIARLETKAQNIVQELSQIDEKIKTSEYDHGLQNQLVHEKQLMVSRLERIKIELRRRGKIELGKEKEVAPPAAGEGGGHH